MVRGVDERAHLLVDRGGDVLGVVAGVTEVAAHEDLALLLPVADRAETLGHAVLRHHRAGDCGRLLDVVGRAGGRVVEDELLGRATAEHVGQLVEHLRTRRRVLVLVRQDHRVAERATTRQDRDLVHRVGVRQRRGDERVATLVVGSDLLLVLAHHAGASLRTSDHTVDRLVERGIVDQLTTLSSGEQRGLVEHVGQVGASEARGTPCDGLEVDAGCEGFAARVDLEDVGAARHVGGAHGDLTVEATGAQQGGVEDVGAVGRGDEDDSAGDVESVHLDEQLVERLLALVVAAAHAGAAVTADSVDLVDEHNRRGVGLRLLEQVADAAGTDADEHLDEVGAGDREERNAGLASDGSGKKRLTGTGLAVQQHALGDLGADGLELRGLLEELLDLLELFHRLVGSGDIGEGRLGHVLADHLGLGLAEVHDAAAATLHLTHEEEEQEDHDRHGDQRDEQAHQDAVLGVVDVVAVLDIAGLHLLLEHVLELDALTIDVLGLLLGAVLERDLDALVTAADERRLLHVSALDGGDDHGGVDVLGAGRIGEHVAREEHEQDDQTDPYDRSTKDASDVHERG